MANPKEQYYWTEVRATLVAGQWSNTTPASAPNAAQLDWHNLLRKFNKHCRGFTDIAQIASHTRNLALLLRANSKDDDQDDARPNEEFVMSLGDTCVLAEERIEEARSGYEALKALQCNHYDTWNMALAYHAYALGNPADCIAHLDQVPNLLHIQAHVPSQPTSTNLQVPATGSDAISLSWSGSFLSEATSAIPEIKDGTAWSITESLRSVCLRGLSYEKLSPNNPQQALDTYSDALPLIASFQPETSPAPQSRPPAVNAPQYAPFAQHRELWRWVELLLWRSICLLSQSSNVHDREDQIWRWFAQYSHCSALWPPSFRTQHRSTISTLYLRALVLRAPSYGHPWISTGRAVINDYRAILSCSTKFPAAGKTNVKVEDFVDLCVAVWEASGSSGEQANWVIDVLWWATRLTFNSYRIFRHMTRMYHVLGDSKLAIRTLRLYVQIVSKAFEANRSGAQKDTDTIQNWILTTSEGARMLARIAAERPFAMEGVDDAKEAVTLAGRAREGLLEEDRELCARVDLAEGVALSVLALTEQEPLTRDHHLLKAHTLLARSVQTYPTHSAHFHLSLSFARAGKTQDLPSAIVQAGLAIEGDPSSIRYWHLLGLLLAATESWDEASQAFESGARIGEETPKLFASDASSSAPDGSRASTLSANQHANTFRETVCVLPSTQVGIPPSSSLLGVLPDHPKPTQQEVFQHALQLRMSQLALTEYTDGTDAAEAFGVDVFAWTGRKRGTNQSRSNQARSSIGSRPLTESEGHSISPGPGPGKSLENLMLSTNTVQPVDGQIPPATQSSLVLAPIPIKISPATPDQEQQHLAGSQIFTNTNTNTNTGDGEKNGSVVLGSEAAGATTGLPMNDSGNLSPTNDKSRSKKMQQLLKTQVHKGQQTIKKIGKGAVKTGESLRRSNSTPDFHALLKATNYQASSIHSRRRISSLIRPTGSGSVRADSPPPSPHALHLPPVNVPEPVKWKGRSKRESRLVSDLWLMCAATFRRSGRIEQAKGAIQEAECVDEENPEVWVQLGLYYSALGRHLQAVETFQKALFISPDDVSASVHLCRLYLTVPQASRRNTTSHTSSSASGASQSNGDTIDQELIDLASGLLSHLTTGVGWDVPEAWYYLAKAYGMQGRREKEKECLKRALELSEFRGVRDVGRAVGWCL